MARASFLLMALVILVAAPTATANQGYLGINSDLGQTQRADGSRAHLLGSASVPSNSGVIASVAVAGATDGFFQFGYIHQGKDIQSDCGGPGSSAIIGYIVEHKHVGNPYLCDVFSASFGFDQQFAAMRTSSTSGFTAYLNGSAYDGPFQLGFPDSGSAYALGEYVGSAPNSYNFTWGPTGEQAWSWTYNYGTVWHNVAYTDPWFKANGGGWTIGNPPSPFSITR